MCKTLTIVWALVMTVLACPAQLLSIPSVRTIRPEDVVQNSVKLVRLSTNSFGVRWTYTDAGAARMLDFTEAHEGKIVAIKVGHFESRAAQQTPFRPMPPAFATYDEWKKGWLKRKTDNMVGLSEADAMAMVAGLTGKL